MKQRLLSEFAAFSETVLLESRNVINVMKNLQILILVLGFFVTVNGQQNEALSNLKGSVIDQMGAVISSTRVVLTNSKGMKFETLTNEDGIYLLRIPPGTYTVEAKYTRSRAWEKFRIEKYEIAATKKMTLDITLRVDESFTDQYGTPITADPVEVKKKPKSP